MRKIFFFIISIILYFTNYAWGVAATQEIFDVIAIGRGINEGDAFDNAIEEALRQQIGSLFLSQETLKDDGLKKKFILVSRGKIRDSEIIKKTQENGLIVLTVRFMIASNEIEEILKSINNYKQLSDDKSVDKVRTFFERIDITRLLDVAIEKTEKDLEKGLLSMTIHLSFKKNLFEKEFASPLKEILNEFNLLNKLNLETTKSDKSATQTTTFFILDTNMSFCGWCISDDFLEAILHGMKLSTMGKTPLRTNKRVWLHVLLKNKEDREIIQIPISLPITNILLFSIWNNTAFNPWILVKNNPISRYNLAVFYAPLFGIASNRDYTYISEAFTGNFDIKLTNEILSQVSDMSIKVNVE